LVFVDHNALLFQFTHKSNEITLHVNRDADEKEVAHSINLMNNAAAERGMPSRTESIMLLFRRMMRMFASNLWRIITDYHSKSVEE
jgi:hypothetical protein